MDRKAKALKRGDVVRLHVYGEVINAIDAGKRVLVSLALEHQGTRHQNGALMKPHNGALHFTDDGQIIQFICRPSRDFHVYDGNDDDDDDQPRPMASRRQQGACMTEGITKQENDWQDKATKVAIESARKIAVGSTPL